MNVRKESGIMNGRLKYTIVHVLIIMFVSAAVAGAREVPQQFTLEPGWNAIFLEVEPADTDPAAVFNGLDIQSVWQWNHRAGTVTVEFIQNPDELAAPEPRMLAYIPGNPAVSNLSAIQGNNAYLVQAGGTGSQNLIITGEPAIPRHVWKSNSYNFTGFHLGNSPPTFEDFFASSPAHDTEDYDERPIYRLNNGVWEPLALTDWMVRGEAYWIYCDGSSNFNGPVSATLEMSSGLHYGDKLFEQQLILHNNSADLLDDPKTITLTLGPFDPVQAVTPIYYWTFDDVNDVPNWQEFPTPETFDVAPGDAHKLRLGVKRTVLTTTDEYAANLEVSTDDGVSFLLPLSVSGIDYSGLWTGYATINKVSDTNKLSGVSYDPDPQPTGSEFDFRLILHVDDGGTVRLLSQVVQMWNGGEENLIPDPDNPGYFIVDVVQPGEFVLFSDETLIASFAGSVLRDGQQIGRRISAPVFPRLPDGNLIMTGGSGQFPEPGAVRSEDVDLTTNNPTNPFYHLFHKDHKATDFDIAEDNYKITRTVKLTFQDEDADGNPITGLPSLNWGSTEVGGVYHETISGLNKRQIQIQGTFVLHRVSNVATFTEVAP